MGLDITAYKNLKAVENPELDEDGELVNWENEWKPGASMEWSEENFPGRGEGIDFKKVYTWKEAFDFRAGSYSGYGWWRHNLDRFMGKTAFQELIDFADNEGVIGFIVAQKLANDFKANYEKVEKFSETLGENGDYWLQSYRNWQKAFEMAADHGAVDFH